MNKNIKKIVAIALAIGTVSAITPATNINLLTTKAYASDENDQNYLDTLNLYNEDGDSIRLYEDTDYKNRIDEDEVEDGEVYYAKTSSDTINIDIDGPSDKYVRVFRGTSSSTKGKEVGDDIKLDSGSSTTTFIVKVFGEEPDTSVRYEDCDDYDVLSTYKIKVKYTDNGTEDGHSDSEDYDNIYLDRLSVDGKMINLSKSEIKYTLDVDSDVDEVSIKATPEDDDYYVTIDGEDVDEDDKYKTDVDLDKGENEFKIELEDDDDYRTYTLVINRGGTSSEVDAETGDDTDNDVSNVKNKWVQVYGRWQYKDATGNSVKNTWMQNYFLQSDGNMATGWLSNNGSWYYLGNDGAKKTGWQSVGGTWYYLDSQGKMQTGWMRDMNGKYYYLNSNGSMAYNTTVGGYRLGANGAWLSR